VANQVNLNEASKVNTVANLSISIYTIEDLLLR